VILWVTLVTEHPGSWWSSKMRLTFMTAKYKLWMVGLFKTNYLWITRPRLPLLIIPCTHINLLCLIFSLKCKIKPRPQCFSLVSGKVMSAWGRYVACVFSVFISAVHRCMVSRLPEYRQATLLFFLKFYLQFLIEGFFRIFNF